MRERRDGPERHDAKADPAWTGGRLPWIEASRTTASICFAGVVGDGMSTRSNGQHGKSRQAKAQDLQPVLREERAGPGGMSEGFIVPMKPVNAGRGKGPWFQDANEVAQEEAIDPWV